jgi:hypothetical protein
MKTKTKKTAADTGSIDTAALVDQIGACMATIAEFEKQKKAMVIELLARAGNRKYIDGHVFTATIVPEYLVSLLDAERIKEVMGDEWVTAHSKESMRKTSVRVTARKTPDQKKE